MKQYKHIFNRISGTLFALTIVSALLFSSPSVSANTSVNDDIKIKIPITCNLSSTVDTAHTASIKQDTI